MISNSAPNHNNMLGTPETFREKSFNSVAFDECASIDIVQTVAELTWEDDLLPVSTPLAVLWAHGNQRRRWFNLREILRREFFACSPWLSRYRRTLGADSYIPLAGLQVAVRSPIAIWMRCVSFRCDAILIVAVAGFWLFWFSSVYF